MILSSEEDDNEPVFTSKSLFSKIIEINFKPLSSQVIFSLISFIKQFRK
uniref:Uncharacterized protein n=1 Tax=Schistosoma curassoni TaxID=6186 RepID=A0A183JQN9_9TREM